MRTPAILPLVLLTAVLSSCSDDQPENAEPVRPVLFVVAEPRAAVLSGFTGTVEAKFSTDLGFQVLGRITARHVRQRTDRDPIGPHPWYVAQIRIGFRSQTVQRRPQAR